MRRQSFKMAVVGGLVALVVLFGIDIATSGVERIYGPLDDSGALPVNRLNDNSAADQRYYSTTVQSGGADVGQQLPEDAGSSLEPHRTVGEAEKGGSRSQTETQQQPVAAQNERLPGIPDTRRDSSVNKLADGTAGLLQSVSSQGIRFIVSFFDSITD